VLKVPLNTNQSISHGRGDRAGLHAVAEPDERVHCSISGD